RSLRAVRGGDGQRVRLLRHAETGKSSQRRGNTERRPAAGGQRVHARVLPRQGRAHGDFVAQGHRGEVGPPGDGRALREGEHGRHHAGGRVADHERVAVVQIEGGGGSGIHEARARKIGGSGLTPEAVGTTVGG